MKKLFKFLTRFSVYSVLSVILIYFFISLIAAKFPEYIISKFVSNNVKIAKITKINNLIIPVYFEAEGIGIRYDNSSFFIKKMTASIDILSFLKNKPFIDIDINGIHSYVTQEFLFEKNEIDYNRYFKHLYVKNFIINSTLFKSEANIDVDNFDFNNPGGVFYLVSRNSYVKRSGLSESFSLEIRGNYERNSLSMQYAKLKGKEIFLTAENLRILDNTTSFSFKGALGEKFINILYDKAKGGVEFSGEIKNKNINANIKTKNISVSDITIDASMNIKGDTSERIKYNFDKLVVDGDPIDAFGEYFKVNNILKGYFSFKKGFTIYKDDDWNVHIKDGDFTFYRDKGNTDARIKLISQEEYNIYGKAVMDKNEFGRIRIDNITCKTSTSTAKGRGWTDMSSLNLEFDADINGNKDVALATGLKGSAEVKSSFYVDYDNLSLTGKYFSVKKQKLYGVDSDSVNGVFDLNYDRVYFEALSKFQESVIDISGRIDFPDKSYFKLTTDKFPFYQLLNFFDIDKKSVKFPISGNMEIKGFGSSYSGNGVLSFQETIFDSNTIWIHFKDSDMYVDKAVVNGVTVKDPVKFDFKNEKIYGDIKGSDLKIKNVPLIKRFNVALSGSIVNPSLKGDADVKLPKLIKRDRVAVSGKLDNVNLRLTYNGLKSEFHYFPYDEKVDGEILLEQFRVTDNLSASGKIVMHSANLKEFYGNSDKLILESSNIGEITGVKIKFLFKDEKVSNISGSLNSEYVKNIVLSDGYLDESVVKGTLSFSNAKINLNDVHKGISGDISGKLFISYDYDKMPEITGKIYGSSKLQMTEYGISLKNADFESIFDRYKVNGRLKASDLDTKINVDFTNDKYYEPYSSNVSLSAKNFFINKYGFMGSIDIDGKYEKIKGFNGEAKIKHGRYEYKKYSINSFAKEKNIEKIPFPLSIKVTSDKSVKIVDMFAEGDADINLLLTYDKQLSLNGDISSSKGKVKVGNEVFKVQKGVIRFNRTSQPYFHLDLSGTGSLSSTKISVDGRMPDYTIELRDNDPLNGRYFQMNRDKTQNRVLTEVLNEEIFKNITEITNKLFGINKIGFDSGSIGKEGGNYIKIGRKFSDRLELKYVFGAQSEGEKVLVGEYILFDWLKFTIFSNQKGGTGAGIIFIANF